MQNDQQPWRLSFAARNQAISRGDKIFYGFKEKWFMHLNTDDSAQPTLSMNGMHELNIILRFQENRRTLKSVILKKKTVHVYIIYL